MERIKKKEVVTWDYDLKRKRIRFKWTECSCGCGKEYKKCDMWELFYWTGGCGYYTGVTDYFSCDEHPTEEDVREKLDSMEKYDNIKYKQKKIIRYV